MSVALLPGGSPGVRDALERMLEDDPEAAATLLAQHGDRDALPALRAALDRLELPSPEAAAAARLEPILELGRAIRVLGGQLAPSLRAKVELASARHGEVAGVDPTPLGAP
jgi:hypothetical protein